MREIQVLNKYLYSQALTPDEYTRVYIADEVDAKFKEITTIAKRVEKLLVDRIEDQKKPWPKHLQ